METKQDKKDLRDLLKPGRIVVYENDRKGIVLENPKMGIYVVIDSGWVNIDPLNENLYDTVSPKWSIKKIYYPNSTSGINTIFKDTECTLIWARPETIELTMDEIAKRFNIPVNVLKIKK